MHSRPVAIVPMRALSRRVPYKNARRLKGKPLHWWILESLLKCEAVGRVCAFTDDPRVHEAGVPDGIELFPLPPKDAQGHNMNSDIRNALDALATTKAREDPDAVFLQTHCTNPFLAPLTLDRAMTEFLSQGDHDALFGVTRMQKRFYRADGSTVNHDRDAAPDTKLVAPLFLDNSCVYITTAGAFRATGSRLGERPMMFEVPPAEAVDIDTWDDFRAAELLARGAGK